MTSKQISQGQYDDQREEFRADVLVAMDKVMNRIAMQWDVTPTRNDVGAQDQDLPELFKAIDAQFAKNVARLGVEVEPSEAELMDRAEQRWATQ